MMTQRKQKRRSWLLPLLALLAFILAACGSGVEDVAPTATTESTTAATPTTVPATETAQPTPTEAMPAATATPTAVAQEGASIFVEEVTANVSDARVTVTISGNLPDACTTIAGSEQSFNLDTNTFMVSLNTDRPEDELCAQVLTPFSQELILETADMQPGEYSVQVQDVSDSFTLTAETQRPDEDATVMIAPDSGSPGTEVALTASDLPANVEVAIGVGRVNSEYDVVDTAVTNANGTLALNVTIPEFSDLNENWVVVVELPSGVKISSNEFVTTSEAAMFDSANIYLIALEDGGAQGEEVGCGDSLVPTEVAFAPTVAPLTAALETMLASDQQFFDDTNLYNAFFQSDLSVEGIDIENGVATIALTGELQMGGVCDAPRMEAQLEATALQYSTIDAVNILVNDQPLDELLSQSG